MSAVKRILEPAAWALLLMAVALLCAWQIQPAQKTCTSSATYSAQSGEQQSGVSCR
jgi:ferric-dicitrate binding protein FerR (iron transport regulator)